MWCSASRVYIIEIGLRMLRLYSSLSPGGRAQAGSLVKRHFGQFDPEGIYMVY